MGNCGKNALQNEHFVNVLNPNWSFPNRGYSGFCVQFRMYEKIASQHNASTVELGNSEPFWKS